MGLDAIGRPEPAGFVPVDPALATLATRQHGVVARRQLLALGLTSDRVQSRLDSGRLHRLHLGVYAVGHRHLTRRGHWMAAVLACGDGALLSHRSAAALWGIGDLELGRVDVTVGHGGTRRRPGIAVHQARQLDDRERSIRDRIPLTSAARTVVDLAATIGTRGLRAVFENAERLEVLDLEELERLCRRACGRRGVGRVRALLREQRGPITFTNSELERSFRRLCVGSGLPTPAMNVPIEGFVVDCAWPKERLVVELDGYEFHRGRASFERDRGRDVALQRAGYRVLRITHRRLVANQGPWSATSRPCSPGRRYEATIGAISAR